MEKQPTRHVTRVSNHSSVERDQHEKHRPKPTVARRVFCVSMMARPHTSEPVTESPISVFFWEFITPAFRIYLSQE